MKNLLIATAATVLLTAPAIAQCEREVTYFSGGALVDPVFYAHGCDAFQYHDLSARQAAQLISAGACSVESSPSGRNTYVQVAVEQPEIDDLVYKVYDEQEPEFETVMVYVETDGMSIRPTCD